MKSITLILIQFLLMSTLIGQIHFADDFTNAQVPYYPTGWTVEGNTENWRTNNTNEAGGSFPEAYFYSNPLLTGFSRLITPEIDLSGEEVVQLSFKHKVQNYLGGYTIGIATRSQGGDWNEVWSVEVTGDIQPETVSIVIDNADVGQSDFQFCMFFSGSSSQAYKWFFDDVVLYSLYDIDAFLVSTEVSDILTKSDIFTINGVMENLGQSTITDFVINWQTDENEIYSEQIAGIDIANGEAYSFSALAPYYVPDELGVYDFKLWLSEINGVEDDYPDNNIIEKDIEVANNAVQLIPVFEEFTSSTCAPCAYFNSGVLLPLLEANPDKYTLIKYQMNWPGTGDPYYTAEGGVRKSYYGVSGVPNLFLNGDDFEQSIFQYQFDEYYALRSKMDLAVSHHLEGSQLSVKAAVIPYDDFSELIVHVVVVENLTTGNTGNNGETEFHNVMMKMMPDALGTVSAFTNNTPFLIDETVDMSTTFVEELDDLSIIVFVQNNSTKEVFQSALSVESENLLLPPMNLLAQVPAYENMINLSWDAPSSSGIEGYNVFRNDEKINNAIIEVTEYSDIEVANGYYTYNVTAVYSDAESIYSNSSTAEKSYYTGIDHTKTNKVEIYPNPANKYFFLKTTSGFDSFEIYKITGQVVYEGIIQNDNTFVNTQDFNPGVYLIKLQSSSNSEIIKLIIQ